jgi:hypothetical protein
MIVYTVLTNNKDILKEPRYFNTIGLKFVVFSDNPELLAGKFKTAWELRPLQKPFDSPRLTARWHKLNSHLLFPDEEWVMWVDANVELKQRPEKFIDGLSDVYVTPHPDRSCIYTEAMFCATARLDKTGLIYNMTDLIRKNNYPFDNGLAETCVLLRKHTESVIKLNEMWWYYLFNYSIRDQISFDYCCWKNNIKWRPISRSEIIKYPHLKRTTARE